MFHPNVVPQLEPPTVPNRHGAHANLLLVLLVVRDPEAALAADSVLLSALLLKKRQEWGPAVVPPVFND
jgi:hypothetical protein